MVGDKFYAMWHETLNIHYSRHVNGDDGVPYMPPSCGGEFEYHHVGMEVRHPADNQ